MRRKTQNWTCSNKKNKKIKSRVRSLPLLPKANLWGFNVMSRRTFFAALLLFPSTASAHRWLRDTPIPSQDPPPASSFSSYTPAQANAFVGAQHWYESGYYAPSGLSSHYDGYFCLCSCQATAEGIFCKGGGVTPSGEKVADFLGVFSETYGGGRWEGDLVAFGTETPFADKFSLTAPGLGANYTGVSQSLQEESFVWRGRMSGVECESKDHCVQACGNEPSFKDWFSECD